MKPPSSYFSQIQFGDYVDPNIAKVAACFDTHELQSYERAAEQLPVTKYTHLPQSQQARGNNYSRPEGQNVGNFLSERNTSKVTHAPGGASQVGVIIIHGAFASVGLVGQI